MILVGSQSIEMVTATADSVDWVTSYTDIDKSGASTVTTPGANQGNVASATTTTIVAAPGASSSQFRVITSVLIRNKGSGTQTITVQKDVSGTNYLVAVFTLYTGEFVVYEDGRGWIAYDANGNQRIIGMQAGLGSSLLINPGFSTANLTTAKTITSGSTFAVYMGRSPRSLTSVQLRLRVTTAMATITWGEVAIAKGSINVGGNPTLTVVGWADVSASYNSLGQKTTTVNVSTGQSVAAGDDLWALIGNAATTALQVRAASIADDIQVGQQASLATRPSLNVGTGQAYTIEGATTAAAWVALVV